MPINVGRAPSSRKVLTPWAAAAVMPSAKRTGWIT